MDVKTANLSVLVQSDPVDELSYLISALNCDQIFKWMCQWVEL